MFLYYLITILLIVLVISISWTSLIGAPFVPTSIRTVLKMLTLADLGQDDLVYDLGCGDGRVLLTAVRRFQARAVGIEIDPLRYLWCRLSTILLGHRDQIQILYGDFFNHDLSGADVVTCYLLQTTNEKLEAKLLRELKPGARVVSYTFTFPNMELLSQDTESQIYCYKING